MRLIYCYIRKFRNIFEEGFNFSIDFECSFKNNNLSIKRSNIDVGEALLLDEFQQRLSLIVGKTGTGKSNILQLIAMEEEKRMAFCRDAEYFLLYYDEDSENRFILETNKIFPKGIVSFAGTSQCFIEFEYKNGKITKSHSTGERTAHDTVITYSYDRNSVSPKYFPEAHVDGSYSPSVFIPRLAFPFENSNPGVVCWYVKQSIEQLEEDNIKRDAVFRFSSINWHEKILTELKPEVAKEYRFYHNNLLDKAWNGVLDVPKFFKDNTLKANGLSLKQQFIHDLLTDNALYLRKWAETIPTVKDERIEMYRNLGMVKDLGIRNFHELPDGRCPDLRQRIDWLCQYLDVHTDEMNANKGLLWQIGQDIISLADLLEKFDDSYFDDGIFTIYIEDMDFGNSDLNSLFEIMANYRADQLGVFRECLLPYEISPLSSGEYQLARVLGVINEFTAKNKMQSTAHKHTKSIILLLDEPETFLHPELCREFLWRMGSIVHENLNDVNVQVIISTHSPFMLSDVLPRQVIRIEADKEGCCRIVKKKETPTFAGDLYSIMANDFFLDYSIGELSRRKLTTVFEIIKEIRSHKELSEEDRFRLDAFRQILPHIGDSLIRDSLQLLLGD